jgi:hypothetical protein
MEMPELHPLEAAPRFLPNKCNENNQKTSKNVNLLGSIPSESTG